MTAKRNAEVSGSALNTEDWAQSLAEIGCDRELTSRIIDAVRADRSDQAAKLLKQQKRFLLERLHDSEKKVDLADFLIYRLKRYKA